MVRRPVIGITAATLHVNGANRHFVSAPYVSAVHNHGGIPILIPPAPDEGIQDYLDLVDGLLIPGGTDVNPVRYGQEPHTSLLAIDDQLDDLELALITAAYERDMPILAICRGIQSLAVALGGTLTQDLPSQHPSDQRHEVRENGRDFLAHDIRIDPRSKLGAILQSDRAAVNTFHHQAVERMPEGLIATAWSDDGLIEAAEAPDKRFVVGLQCHPEELWNTTAPEFSRLFASFIEACQYAVEPAGVSSTRTPS